MKSLGRIMANYRTCGYTVNGESVIPALVLGPIDLIRNVNKIPRDETDIPIDAIMEKLTPTQNALIKASNSYLVVEGNMAFGQRKDTYFFFDAIRTKHPSN